jgi:hypothetical protein
MNAGPVSTFPPKPVRRQAPFYHYIYQNMLAKLVETLKGALAATGGHVQRTGESVYTGPGWQARRRKPASGSLALRIGRVDTTLTDATNAYVNLIAKANAAGVIVPDDLAAARAAAGAAGRALAQAVEA